MNLDFSEIQKVESSIDLTDFEDLFCRLERNAFLLRGNSTSFYIFLNQFFEKENIDESIKKMLLKCLIKHEGNWSHDFLIGLYESLTQSKMKEENNLSISDTDLELLKSLVSLKIKELDTFSYDVYTLEGKEVTRFIYETKKIITYLNKQEFTEKFKSVYFEVLKKEINNSIDIRDGSYHNWQSITNDFLIWIDKQLINIRLKERQQESTTNKNHYPFYCKVGALFAKGQILFKNQKYYYCNNSFISIAKLSNHIQNEVLKTNKTVRQYVNDTIYNTGRKNFYKSYTMMKNIVDYCNNKNIEITTEFQDIYDELEKLH